MVHPKLILCNGWRAVHGYLVETVKRRGAETPPAVRDILLVVPTAAAGHLLHDLLEATLLADKPAGFFPTIHTRKSLFKELAERSLGNAALVDPIVREVIFDKAVEDTITSGVSPPFSVKAGLTDKMLALYDRVSLAGHSIEEFSQHASEEFDVPGDIGAERMAAQTRFLLNCLQHYQERLHRLHLADNTTIYQSLLQCGSRNPYTHTIIVGTDTLHPTDLAFLRSLRGLNSLEIVIPEGLRATHSIRRLQKTCAMEIIRHRIKLPDPTRISPITSDEIAVVARDREEVLTEVARLLKLHDAIGRLPALQRIAVVVPTPLPSMYVAKKVFGQAGIPFQFQEDFPLSSEPYLAAIDLLLDFVESEGRWSAAKHLLKSPFFQFPGVGPAALTKFDEALIRSGRTAQWVHIQATQRRRPVQLTIPGFEGVDHARPMKAVIEALVRVTRTVTPLADPMTSATDKLLALATCLDQFGRPLTDLSSSERHQRARGALLSITDRLADAAGLIGDPPLTFHAFRKQLTRAIQRQTFSERTGNGGVQVVDAKSAGCGSFDLVILVGLNEGEWPARSARNIFYPQWFLKKFDWPTDQDSLIHERLAFLELLRLSSGSCAVFRHQLEEDAPTVPSPFLEHVTALPPEPTNRLSLSDTTQLIISRAEALRLHCVPPRRAPSRRKRPGMLNRTLPRPEPISASAFETYLQCPFKYYARYVLHLEEESATQGLTPLEQGRIVHEILREGFHRWDSLNGRPQHVTDTAYAEALALFKTVAEEKLPPEHRAVEMARLFGSPGHIGTIEWVLRQECSREPLKQRLLEYPFRMALTLDEGPNGEHPWIVDVKGRVDRVDIDVHGNLHLFDYKIGKVPDPRVTIQVPLYSTCLAQSFNARPVEAVYLSLREQKAVSRDDFQGTSSVLRETFASIAAGSFPPRPYQDHLCRTCGYVGVCRKEIQVSGPADERREADEIP